MNAEPPAVAGGDLGVGFGLGLDTRNTSSNIKITTRYRRWFCALHKEQRLKYMLMMNAMRNDNNYAGASGWQKNDVETHIAYLKNLTKSLRESGELVSTEGLDLPQRAKTVRCGKNGAPITDGVFPESKEFLAGYWIVNVDSAEQAYAIAARASAAPGPGAKPLNMPIEVRQVMSGPPPEIL